MHVRSKALWQYLHDTGALSQGEEAIAQAKAAYRREYKRKWKAERPIKKKDVRLTLTPKEYHELHIVAAEAKCAPATYCKQIILAGIGNSVPVLNRERLKDAYQRIGMGVNLIAKVTHYFPGEAEEALKYFMEAEALMHQCMNGKQ